MDKLIADLQNPALALGDHQEALKVYEWCIAGRSGIGTIDDLAALVPPDAASCWMRDVGWRELPGEYGSVGVLFTHPSDDPESCEYGEGTIHLGGPSGYPAVMLRFKTEPSEAA
jgi:hypothetical protein